MASFRITNNVPVKTLLFSPVLVTLEIRVNEDKILQSKPTNSETWTDVYDLKLLIPA